MKATKETKTKMKAKMKTKIANAKEVWEVEEVVGSLIEADTYIHYYEVKWKGYSSKEIRGSPRRIYRPAKRPLRDLSKQGEEGGLSS